MITNDGPNERNGELKCVAIISRKKREMFIFNNIKTLNRGELSNYCKKKCVRSEIIHNLMDICMIMMSLESQF